MSLQKNEMKNVNTNIIFLFDVECPRLILNKEQTRNWPPLVFINLTYITKKGMFPINELQFLNT